MKPSAERRTAEEQDIARLLDAAEACMEAAAGLRAEATRYYREAQLRRETLNKEITEVSTVANTPNITT